MTQPRALGLLLLIVIGVFRILTGFADVTNGTGQDSITPTWEVLEFPHATYGFGDTITFRVRLGWPETEDSLRLDQPDLDLDNLELIGISEETRSETNPSEIGKHILDFSFRAIKPGVARINRIGLRWKDSKGEISSRISIPGLSFIIKPKPRLWFYVASVGAVFLLGASGALGWYVFQRPKHKRDQPETISFLETFLNDLKNTKAEWQFKGNDEKFLSEIFRIADLFLSQELDWHLKRESYNALKERAEGKWTRREVITITRFLDRLKQERFSGEIPKRDEIEATYHILFSFIEQKKVIPIE